MTELSENAKDMLVREMNETKYAAMVYTMAKRSGKVPAGSKIASCKVTSLTSTECQVSYVTCSGDICAMPKTTTYKFNPPIQGDKVYMLRLQSRVCAPKFHWLFTKPLALLVLVICSVLSIGTMGMGVAGITAFLDKAPRLENGVAAIFGSAHNFAVAFLAAWCVAVIAHFAEAAWAYRQCEMALRFTNKESSQWALLVFLVGHPIFQELQELVAAKKLHAKSK